MAAAIRGLPSLATLDPLEERIMTFILNAIRKENRLAVTDVMAQNELGSPATIHSRLKSMRKKGWIHLTDTDDSRRKRIELTPGALQYFDKLSQAMTMAAESQI